jgi:hypothetical protein
VPTFMTTRIGCAGFCGERIFAPLPRGSDVEHTASRGEGQHIYPAVRMAYLAR